MSDDALDKNILAEYKKIYPKWKSVRVTQVVQDTFGGTLAVVAAVDEDGDEIDEMCFVFENGKVQIFQSTEQLSIFLDSRTRLPWYQRVFATSTLSGVVFLLSIVLIFVSALIPDFNEKVSAVLGTLVGSAAGFYFGSSRSRS